MTPTERALMELLVETLEFLGHLLDVTAGIIHDGSEANYTWEAAREMYDKARAALAAHAQAGRTEDSMERPS